MTKTNWNNNTKPKDSWSGQDSNKTAFSEGTKNKTGLSEGLKQKTDFTHPGNESYVMREVLFDDPDVNFDDGECNFDGPLRITTYAAGKEMAGWGESGKNKTGYQERSKPKTDYSESERNKTVFSGSTKNKTGFAEGSRQKTDSAFPGDGSYTLLDVLINAAVLINEGECMINGPLRVTTYSTGKVKSHWS